MGLLFDRQPTETMTIQQESRYYEIQAAASERRAAFNKMKDVPVAIRIASRGAFGPGYVKHLSEDDKAEAIAWSAANPSYSFGIDAAQIIKEA